MHACTHAGGAGDHTYRLVLAALVRVEIAENRSANQERQSVGLAQRDVHQEEHEVLLVVPPHAVVHPRAVVVHLEDAAVAL